MAVLARIVRGDCVSPRTMRFVASSVAVLVLAGALPAFAAWSLSGSGPGNALAKTMPGGSAPTPSVTGRNVLVSWPEATLSGGTPASGYVVKRYDTSSVVQTIGSGCGGVIGALSCTEIAVAPGTWRYTVTPKLQAWTGAESAQSSNAVVGAPTLTLDPPTSVPSSSLPATMNGTIANFVDGESIRFRLDGVGGDVLSGSVAGTGTPAPVPAGGGGAVTVTVPAGTSIGAHSIVAVASPSDENASSGITITGIAPPTITASVAGSTPNNGASRVRPGGDYRILANITGTVDSASVDVSTVTAGATSVALTPCTSNCTIHGTSYGYKGTTLTAGGGLAGGTYSYTVTASNGGGSDTESFTLTIDATRPRPTGLLELNNGAGNELEVVETGDQIVVTFDEPLAVNTLCTGWDNNAANQSATVTVTVHNGDNKTHDSIDMAGASCGTLNFGVIDVGAHGYLKDGDVSFSDSAVSWDATTFKLRITLGTPCTPSATCGSPATQGQPVTTAIYTPAVAIQDLAGNGIEGTVNSVQKKQF